ncbi:TPR repeat-containing protein [Humidesulfovibrio mexicanus]|uniref:TPR repeat-containing protein n=1 Tax=Humidesulfovibrio mexicanus TaxID=147047 RepID=A0A238ZED4_9BACT|nr:tetratricopeptide repeat protein [Humidesulfovibrio mexicanus]SNR81876.1 TPR repeat-containing protein [Humidesulfovibrio mexicanus]
MREHIAVFLLSGMVVLGAAGGAQAQKLPRECQEAMAVRSPQAQVELFSRCLDTGRLSGADKATTLKQRAVAYMHLGRHQRAIDDVNEAIRIRSDDPDNYYLRGMAYRALGQHRQSIEDSTRAINLDSKFAAAYANRAFSLKATGKESQAKADARRAQELDSSVRVPGF